MPALLVRAEQRRARRAARRAQLVDRGALLAEERAAEPGDEPARGSRPRRTRRARGRGAGSAAARGARRAAGRSARAVPNCSYSMLDVVGPRQDLRVQALHVVALVERVDDGLPVRVDDRRAVRRGSASRRGGTARAASGSGSRKSSSGSASGSRLTNTKPPQRSTRTGREREVVGQAGELLAVDDTSTSRRRARSASRGTGTGSRRRRTCRSPSARRVPRCRHALWNACDRAGRRRARRAIDSSPIVYSTKSPGAGDLLLAARDLPDPRPQPLQLELGERARSCSAPSARSRRAARAEPSGRSCQNRTVASRA